MKTSFALAVLAVVLSSSARPAPQASSSFTLQNGEDAIALNQKFAGLTASSPCQPGENACVNQQFAQCVGSTFTLQSCGGGTICAALPLVNAPGTTITCTTQADLTSRIAATGASAGNVSSAPPSAAPPSASATVPAVTSSVAKPTSTVASNNGATGGSATNNNTVSGNAGNNSTGSGNAGNNSTGSGGDLQSSLSLDPSLVQKGFEQDGQQVPAAGQVASLTSSDNYINFCATVPNLPLTNGQQVKGGSCNAAPMGIIASSANMPSSKFINPENLAVLKANTPFTISMAISHLTTGNFVNADSNYFSAPQQVDKNGDIFGHSHVVIEALTSLKQTTPTDPTKFAFFKGLNEPAANGVLSANVTSGLPAGVYKLSSINSAANHQPALVAIAQHGTLDDQIYFTVTADGQPDATSTGVPAVPLTGTASNTTASVPAPAKTPEAPKASQN